MAEEMADVESSVSPSKTEADVELSEHDVPVLTPTDMERNVLIGTCGVQAAGKTVFLASIFHTMNGEEVPGIGHISFDREDKGGALYFERVENEIRGTGSITPTREPAVARLMVEPVTPSVSTEEDVGIVLFDFAGGYFTQFSDLPAALAAADTPEERRELELVNRYLERCDAFIVLVDSQNFGRDGIAAQLSPFPPTVTFLRTYCRRNDKPLALVFTKKDLNPGLSSGGVGCFLEVQKFQKIFSEDPTHVGRPFGLVEHLSCYEIDSTGDVREQSSDGSIWCLEPSAAFVRILKAAWPKAMQRLEADREARRQQQAEERSRGFWKFAKRGLLAAATLVVLSSPVLFSTVRDHIKLREATVVARGVVNDLNRGSLYGVTSEEVEIVRWFGDQEREGAEAVAWSTLKSAFKEILDSVTGRYPLGGDEVEVTRMLLELGDVLELVGDSTKLLSDRLRFLVADSGDLTHEERLRLVEGALQGADNSGDDAFEENLKDEASKLREEVARGLAQPGYAESTLADRVRFVRLGLRQVDTEENSEMGVAAKHAYARLLGASLASLRERERLIQLITQTMPDLKGFISVPELGYRQVLEYRVLKEEATKPRALDEWRALHTRLEPLLQEVVAGREESAQLLLSATFEDLFRGLGPGDRRTVWSGFFEGAESEYFFVLRPDAWPRSVRPWIRELRGRLESESASKATSDQALREISQRPLYWSEAHDVAGFIASRYLDFATARCYREVLSIVENGFTNLYSATRQLRTLASLAETTQMRYTSLFGEPLGVLDSRRETASSLASQAEIVDNSYLRSKFIRDLRSDLEAICAKRLDSTEGDCAS